MDSFHSILANINFRREEVVIARVPIGQHMVTHGFLIEKGNPPQCPFCCIIL